MEEFGKSRKEFLAKFLELPNGILDSDTFRRVFEKIDPAELSSCLNNWINTERDKDNSPLNMNILRKTALNLVSQSQYGRISKKKLMFKAALDPDLLLKILFFPKK